MKLGANLQKAVLAVFILLWIGWCLLALTIPPTRDVRILSPVGASTWGAPLLTASLPDLALVPMLLIQVFSAWVLGAWGWRCFFPESLKPRSQEKSLAKDALILGSFFIPGYLGWIAIYRTLSVVFPNGIAMPLAWALQLALLGWTARSWRFNLHRAKAAALVGFGLGFWLLFQIQFSFTHVTGDAYLFIRSLLGSAEESGILDPWSRLPRLNQQYDEFLFWYPSLAWHANEASIGSLALWWVIGAAGKLSAFSLTTLACLRLLNNAAEVRPFGRLVWATLISIFLFFGAHGIDPRASFLLFDSSNPGANLLQNGRLIHAFLPLWLLALIDRDCLFLSQPRTKFGLALLAVGLSSVTLPHLITLLMVPVWIAAQNRSNSPASWEEKIPFFAFPLAFFLAYPSNTEAPLHSGGAVWIVLGLLAGAWIARQATSFGLRQLLSSLSPTWFWLPLMMGHLLLGNLLALDLTGLLPPLIDRVNDEPMQGAFGIMRSELCSQWPTQHCASHAHFVGHFGLPLALCAAVFWRTQKSPPWLTRVGAWTTVAFGAAVFLYDWLQAPNSSPSHLWVRSRLVEPFFYTLLALPFIVLLQEGKRSRLTAGILIFAFTAGPLFLEFESSVLHQLWINASFLLNLTPSP